MGLLGWSPEVFWNARVMDILDAVDGSGMHQGIMPPDVGREIKKNEERRRLDELEELMQQYPD